MYIWIEYDELADGARRFDGWFEAAAVDRADGRCIASVPARGASLLSCILPSSPECFASAEAAVPAIFTVRGGSVRVAAPREGPTKLKPLPLGAEAVPTEARGKAFRVATTTAAVAAERPS